MVLYNRFILYGVNRFYYYGIVLYASTCFLFAYLYINLPHYENSLRDILLSQSIDGTDASSDRLIRALVNPDKDFLEENSHNPELRVQNEKLLESFKNRNISSAYVIFFFENQFFFLLDSSLEDRGEFGEVFKLEERNSFLSAKESKSRKIVIQDSISDLGFTLIKPISTDKNSVFLVIDYTQKTYNSLTSLLRLSVRTIMIFLILVLLLLTFFIFYFLRNLYIRNRMYTNPKTGTFYRSYLTDHYEKINFSNYYIVLADIDFFKRINDLYGQENGDKVINSVMKKIFLSLKKEDMFIQYGGEEFLLLISKKNSSIESFKYRLEDIRVMVERLNINISKDIVKLTLSFGAFIQSEVASSLQDAIHKADTALYESKHKGRNRIHYFDVSDEKLIYREKLKELIESDNLVCYYQPIMHLEENRLSHYEALLRLKDGDNIIFPDKILPELEDSYFYSRISMNVIEYNLKKLRANNKLKVSINLSADDLLNDSILSLLIKNSEIAERLLIEILENKSVDYHRVETSIQTLRIFGYKICIDDFGSGYSNIDHLLHLSIDYLKLDGVMIRNIDNDKKVHSIIEALVFFCETNSIKVVAEFVENQEIVELLKGFGVEYGQGYHFSRPMPYEHFFKDDKKEDS